MWAENCKLVWAADWLRNCEFYWKFAIINRETIKTWLKIKNKHLQIVFVYILILIGLFVKSVRVNGSRYHHYYFLFFDFSHHMSVENKRLRIQKLLSFDFSIFFYRLKIQKHLSFYDSKTFIVLWFKNFYRLKIQKLLSF